MKKLLYCAVLMFLALILVSCVYKTYRLDEKAVKEALTDNGISGVPEAADLSQTDSKPLYASDIIACIMVDGKLYYDTGRASTVKYRCGVMDGNIDSTVGSNRLPQKDNQSNFGEDYGYQYGPREGTIEVLLQDGEWRIFATEEVFEDLLNEYSDSSFNDDTKQGSDIIGCPNELVTTECFPDLEENTFKVTEFSVFELGKGTLKRAVNISAIDALKITDLLYQNGEYWTDGTSDCLTDCAINIKGFLYYYHSECGTFIKLNLADAAIFSHVEPQDNGKSLTLSESDRETVNGILEKYISLSPAVSQSVE